jgi:hypothetical protein
MAAKPDGGAATEAMLQMQGIALAEGRAQRIADGLTATIGASLECATRARLELDDEPGAYPLALGRCKSA